MSGKSRGRKIGRRANRHDTKIKVEREEQTKQHKSEKQGNTGASQPDSSKTPRAKTMKTQR